MEDGGRQKIEQRLCQAKKVSLNLGDTSGAFSLSSSTTTPKVLSEGRTPLLHRLRHQLFHLLLKVVWWLD